MDSISIIKGGKSSIKKNFKFLANDYKEKTGRVVCGSCSGDIAQMINKLKLIYSMKNFQLKSAFAQYKNKKGDRTTVSNASLTDEVAVEFLATNPDRIKLFSKYPENWKELIELDDEGVVDLSAASAAAASDNADANALAAALGGSGTVDAMLKQGDVDAAADENEISDGQGDIDEDCDCGDSHEPCDDCIEKKRAKLMVMKLPEIRAAYPEFTGKNVKVIADKVIANDLKKSE